MKLWKVRVRFWPHKEGTKGYQDASVLLEAEDSDAAVLAGFEAIMGTTFFGRDQTQCLPMEAATVTLPYHL